MIKDLSKIMVSAAALYFMGMATGGLVIVGCFTIGVIPTILTFVVAYALWVGIAVYRRWYE